MTKRKVINLGIALLVLGALTFWIYKEITRPLPGEAAPDLGREHVTDIAGVEYSSNPPSSGPHFAIWAKKGVYDRLISDGYFIHSLEHGYVVISYDCTKPLAVNSFVSSVLAHDEPAEESTDSGELLKHMNVGEGAAMGWFTPDNPPEVEVTLPEEFNSENCANLVGELTSLTSLAERIIVAPRLNLDSPIALTAWGRVLKLDSVDAEKIKEFIQVFHNAGPEKTEE